ncbi:MAG TPA: glycosyltransferase family 9 protein, partial [Alphaproteobacteria bacterium]|nr:glycosyltransferase family 9 protein [Alphaproteobacteria bacterium]
MRLLYITSNRIGDAVLSTGLLDHLLRRHPGAATTIACGALAAPLFRAVPGLERLIVLEKRSWNRHWLGLWRQVVGTRWDLVVDLRDSAVGYALRARRTIRHRRLPGVHVVEELAALVDAAPPPLPRLWIDPASEAEAARLMAPARGAPVIALAPIANWPGKQWPLERFGAVAEALAAPGGALPGARFAILTAGGAEAEAAAPLLARLGPDRAFALGGLDLALVGASLRRCALLVGNDSGLMHMAAAAGIPTLGLFGPTD